MPELLFTQFDGGIAFNTKSGLLNACRASKGLDIYSDSDSVSLNPKAIKQSSTNVLGLVKVIVDASPHTGDKWGYDDAGNIYRSDGSFWNLERTGVDVGHDAAGQGMVILNNDLFYATKDSIGKAGPLSSGTGSMTYDDDIFTDDVLNLDVGQSGSGQTYTIPTSITETAVNTIDFTPAHDPIKCLKIIFGTKGTGAITVSIHDADDNTVASKQVANIDLPASGAYEFTFDTPFRPVLGKDYHFHLTSTVADATIQTGTTADFSTADYKVLFSILLDDDEFHPMIQHTNGVTGTWVVGNVDYIGEFDGETYNPNRIKIEPGYKIRGFFRKDEFIGAYCWKGESVSGGEEGRIFYWDGIANYYNYSEPVNGGVPNAIVNLKGRPFSILGSRGQLAIDTAPFHKLQTAPALNRGKRVEVLPNALTVWRDRAVFAYANSNDVGGLQRGVYEYGNNSDKALAIDDVSNDVLNHLTVISTDTTDELDMQIGCLFAAGGLLLIAWKDDTTYGIDYLALTSDPTPDAYWESLILDYGAKRGGYSHMPQKTKQAKKLVISFVTLPEGCTITPKYKIDREANWHEGTTAVAGSKTAEINFESLGNMRYKEIEIGFNISATVNYPTITGVYFDFDSLEKERMDS